MTTEEDISDEEFLQRIIVEDDIVDDPDRLALAFAYLESYSGTDSPAEVDDNLIAEDIGQRTNPEESRAVAAFLLEADDETFRNLFRMDKAVFLALCSWLRSHTAVRDSRAMYLEQKVMIFCFILAYGAPQRVTAHKFFVNQGTVSRVVHEMLDAFLVLHNCFVKRTTMLSMKVELDELFLQFTGANSAIDGTHVGAHIPASQQARWWSRKHKISQNILAEVDLDNNLFTYVLAGAEGSIHDSSLMRIACTTNLHLARNRLVLADAGFGSRNGLLLPFTGSLYHLREYRERGEHPQNERELYNLRHSQLRVTVERVFGMWKRKFRILRDSPPEYEFDDQQLIIYATAGLYNFILTGGVLPEQVRRENERGLTEAERQAMEAAEVRADTILPAYNSRQMRENIATWLWEEGYDADSEEINGLEDSPERSPEGSGESDV